MPSQQRTHPKQRLTRLAFEVCEFRLCLTDVTFVAHEIVSSDANQPESVFAADIDGDGDNDALFASSLDGRIGWYPNTDGQGTFGRPNTITNQFRDANWTRAVDLDEDGDVDVVAANGEDIVWFENTDGVGGFEATRHIASSVSPWIESVHMADIDGDGDLDILTGSGACHSARSVGCRYRGRIDWYENSGAGAFIRQEPIRNLNSIVTSVSSADVDGDNDLDLLYSSHRKTAWLENTGGQATFKLRKTIDVRHANALYPEDVDRDGDLDVIVGKWGQITWHENVDGQGTFARRREIVADDVGGESMHVADLDDDGNIEVLSAYQDGRIASYENTDGNGTFHVSSIIGTQAKSANALSVADLDGDGDVDVLASSSWDDQVSWYANVDGRGKSFGPQRLISAIGAPRAQSVYASDVDGDGDTDVLSASEGDDRVAWYENTDGEGTFSLPRDITTDASRANFVTTSDMDGDGDLDVLSASRGDASIVWYENTDGRGAFGSKRTISEMADYAPSLFVGDLDNDSDVDVVSATPKDGTVIWHENTDGLGTFARREVLLVISVKWDWITVHASDLDEDNDLDVISFACCLEPSINWNENVDGQGTFGPPDPITTDIQAMLFGLASVQGADVDGDGDRDVLFASGDGWSSKYGEIGWIENKDDQISFGPKRVIAARSGDSRSVYGVDLDGDGDIDVLSARGNDIIWFENTDGSGTFGPEHLIADTAIGARSVFGKDLDGDGDLDVLSASWNNGQIAWYENRIIGDVNDDGVFDSVDISQVLSLARYDTGEFATFEQGDWNRDGVFDRQDIIAALQTGNYRK